MLNNPSHEWQAQIPQNVSKEKILMNPYGHKYRYIPNVLSEGKIVKNPYVTKHHKKTLIVLCEKNN